jgi:glycosyltransferase involved in cell wall biosynthesis
MRGCNKVVAVSESIATAMAALPYARPSQIVLIRNGGRTLPVLSIPEPKTAFTAITVARLAAPKDHATLLRAIALVTPQIPDLKTLIVGGGPMEGELRALSEELGISGRVHFLGDRDDVGDWLARSDLFVLSSRSEGLPISMLEAMAAGLPMIMSDVGGIRETVGHLPGVILVPAENPSAMADALLDFSRRRQELPALGQANQRYFRQNYSAESMANAYAALYAECLD